MILVVRVPGTEVPRLGPFACPPACPPGCPPAWLQVDQLEALVLNPPSLVHATALTVKGAVKFEKGEGRAELATGQCRRCAMLAVMPSCHMVWHPAACRAEGGLACALCSLGWGTAFAWTMRAGLPDAFQSGEVLSCDCITTPGPAPTPISPSPLSPALWARTCSCTPLSRRALQAWSLKGSVWWRPLGRGPRCCRPQSTPRAPTSRSGCPSQCRQRCPPELAKPGAGGAR